MTTEHSDLTPLTLLVMGDSLNTPAAWHALMIAQAAFERGQPVSQVFFFADGVSIANADIDLADNEPNPQSAWSRFSRDSGVPLRVCSTSAERRGVVSASRPLASPFELAGLGAFQSSLVMAERLVTFK